MSDKGWRAARYAERITVEGRPIHPDAPHGTYTGYKNWGCRCDDCRAANAERQRDFVNSHDWVPVDGRRYVPAAPHGTCAGYTSWGCQCDPCTQANTDYMREYYRAKRKAEAR